MKNFPLAALVLAFAVSQSNSATAVEATNSLDRIVQLYQQNAKAWEQTLTNYAQTLFWLLAAIEMGFVGIRLAFRGADFSEWAAEIINQILFVGFFLTLLLNSGVWARAIVDSFRTAANQAVQASGGSSLIAPSDIFAIGLDMANKLLDQTSIWSAGASIGLIIFALVLLVCFALIGAFLVLALVESYVVISAGVLFMGFGGSRFTKDYALKIVIYAVSVGAKLFVLQLLIGLGQQIFHTLLQNFGTNSGDVLIVVGSAIVMLALTKFIPDMVQGLINGVSLGGAGVLVAGGKDVYAAGKAVAADAIGEQMMLTNAGRLASEQMTERQLNGTAAQTRLGRGMQYSRAVAGNVVKAAAENVGYRLSGRAHFGTRYGQMSDALKLRAEELRKAREGRGQQSGSATNQAAARKLPTGAAPSSAAAQPASAANPRGPRSGPQTS